MALTTRHPFPTTAAAVLALLLLLAGCGTDDAASDTADAASDTADPTEEAAPTATEEAAPTATEEAAAEAGDTLELTAVDYAYEGVPGEVSVGTQLALVGAPDAEPHEAVVFRLAEDETRSAQEILAEGGPDAPPPGEFAGVLIAPPGGAPGFAPEGPVVLDQPGRYLLVCFIPVGTTPDAFAALAEDGGTAADLPETGPPHFTQGMAAELTVAA
ncbi:hypothetical protein [Euzebya pacifica]|uniref:hypothetical protein n=1 Tax=Euzebya pacifica TaxID=1608957 RepID=UPI0030FD1DD4